MQGANATLFRFPTEAYTSARCRDLSDKHFSAHLS